MPRIPDETIERLKQEVSVERLAEARGVKLARHGADLLGLCPFHDDRSPSLVVSPKKNLWHCLGACQTGGTVIDWVMKAEGVSFRHAVELLRADVPVGGAAPVKISTVRKLPAPVDVSRDDAGAMEQVVAFYHETLKQAPEALRYLEKRGLNHPEMVERFRLGYANRSLGLRLPAKNRKAGEEIRTRLEKLGIMRDTGHEHFNGSVVIPVEGPVMIFLTTTAIDLDEELLNRCLVLTVNEDRGQTRAIHRLQRERQTIEGLLARQEREEILKVHRNAQRLLRPLFVANPWARELTFPDGQTRTRRDHMKYLALIRSVALLRQFQRPVKTAMHRGKVIEYIEATLDDIAVANRLAHEVLGRSLDELPPQTRRLLLLLDGMVKGACERLQMERGDFRFSRREVRAFTGWGDTQLKVHLRRLEEMEYLLAHRGGRGQSFVYELVYEAGAGDSKMVFPGLIDVDKLQYDGKKAGVKGEKAGAGRVPVGGMAGGGRSDSSPVFTGSGAYYAAAEA